MGTRRRALFMILLCGSLGLVSPKLAAGVVLSFDFPRTLTPSGFVITAVADGQPTNATLIVTPSAAGACTAVDSTSTVDTYCASVGCLPPGRYRFFVQAQIGSQPSAPSETVGCVMDAQCRCTLLAPGAALAPSGSALPPTSLPPRTAPLAPVQPPAAPTFAALPIPPRPPPPSGAT
jgi:hypothetical protein